MTSTSVVWCKESFTESTTSVPAATGSIQLQAPTTGSTPLLLLLPPETAGGETTTFPLLLDPCPPQATPPSAPHNRDIEDEEGEEGSEERLRDNLSPPEVENFLLLRSSPVISRRHRPVSWHGGEAAASRSSPGSPGSPGRPALVRTEEDCPPSSSLQDNKQHRVSSHLNQFLTSLFHLPSSGLQGLAGEHRGRRPTSCEAPPTAGLSTKHRSSFPDFSADIFKTSCDLEKENAHFVVVDLVLEALEAVKWTLNDGRRTSTTEDTHTQHDNRQRQTSTHRRTQEDDNRQRQSNRRTNEDKHQLTGVVSTDSEAEDAGGDGTLTLRSAEWLAQRLVLEFRRNWFPSHEPRGGRQSLRSSLQELPGTGGVAASGGSLTEEIRLRTRMRGSLSWAPPRLQIIFTLQPTLRRSEVVASQHFLCAGCGTEVEPRYMKKLRYCEYLGRYFCDCCHGGSEAVIPARVLSCWDFNRFPVSDFSKQLLDSVWFLPLFDLSCVCEQLSSRVRELLRFRELLDQLLSVRKLLKTCRLSERVMTEMEQLPSHLVLQQPPLLSMDDLLRLRRGQLGAQVKAAVHAAISHVEDCELCLARGFICEFCREGNVLFPFQSDACSRCPVCRTCFHKHCFVEKKCPKCSRIKSRRKDGSTRGES